MNVLAFRRRQPVIDVCTVCGRPTSTHEVNGQWIGCARDVVLGQDLTAASRRLRLALLQTRVVKVKPFGVDLALALVFGVLSIVGLAAAQTPRATPWDYAHAQLEIGDDFKSVTVRSVAPDDLRVCVEPRDGQFGPRRCFSVGAIRRGQVGYLR